MKTVMGVFFVLDFWKGKRKEKEVSSLTPVDGSRPYLLPEASGACLQLSAEPTEEAQRRLDCAALQSMVQLPEGLERNEWLATHALAFFNMTNQLCAVCSEYCTPEACPTMAIPGNSGLLWHDEKGKKSKHSAPVHISMVMSSVASMLRDETIFPTKYGNQFPVFFESSVRRLVRHLLHVIAHLYHAHFRLLQQLELHCQLNSLLAHFFTFCSTHSLLEDKDFEPLADLLQLWTLPQQNSLSSTPLPIPTGRASTSSTHSSASSPSTRGQMMEQRLQRSPRERSSSPILVHSPTLSDHAPSSRHHSVLIPNSHTASASKPLIAI